MRIPAEGRIGMVARSSTVTLLLFPRDDDAFGSVLERIAAEVGDLKGVAPEQLQRRLRAHYPGAVVRAQDPLGGLDASRSAWYVYRDGSPITS
jgi:hypothetical protein